MCRALRGCFPQEYLRSFPQFQWHASSPQTSRCIMECAPSATGGEGEALSLPQQVRQKQLKPWKLFLSHHRAGGVGIGGRRLFLWFFFCVVTKERTLVERRRAQEYPSCHPPFYCK